MPTMKTPHWFPFGDDGAPVERAMTLGFPLRNGVISLPGGETVAVLDRADELALLLAVEAGVDAELGPGAGEVPGSVTERIDARGRRGTILPELFCMKL